MLAVSTGGSTSASRTYLRLLLDGCIDAGALYVACSSSESREFEGVALWGPPSDDWLPWFVPPTPCFLPLITLFQGRGGVLVSITEREERLGNPPRKFSLFYLRFKPCWSSKHEYHRQYPDTRSCTALLSVHGDTTPA